MIRTTLAPYPAGCTMLAAKAAILLAGVLATATVGVLGSLLAGRLILPGNGFTAAHGYARSPSPTAPHYAPPPARSSTSALIALLSLGVATAVRDTATAIGIVLGLLYLFPILAQTVTDQTWQRRLHADRPHDRGALHPDHSRRP